MSRDCGEERGGEQQVKAEVRSSSVCQPDSNTAAAWEERQLKTSSPINLAPALLPQPPLLSYITFCHFSLFYKYSLAFLLTELTLRGALKKMAKVGILSQQSQQFSHNTGIT